MEGGRAMTTSTELRERLAALEGERDRIYAELLPFAQAGRDHRIRWSDFDLAAWLGASVSDVRAQIVEHLSEFWVDDNCAAALLTVAEIAELTADAKLKSPRIQEVDFIAGELALTTRYLAELEERPRL